jgi:hypothetical protein
MKVIVIKKIYIYKKNQIDIIKSLKLGIKL